VGSLVPAWLPAPRQYSRIARVFYSYACLSGADRVTGVEQSGNYSQQYHRLLLLGWEGGGGYCRVFVRH